MKTLRSIYVDREAWDRFKQFCHENGYSASYFINSIILNMIGKQESKNINININIVPVQIKQNNNLIVKWHEKRLNEWLKIAEECLRENRPIPLKVKREIEKALKYVNLEEKEKYELIEKILLS